MPEMHSTAEVVVGTSVEKEEKRRLFEDLVDRLSLRQFLDLPMIALSNGQTRKARIIKAFLERPELLILDEPLSKFFDYYFFPLALVF